MCRRLTLKQFLTLLLLTSESQDEEDLLLLLAWANCECPLKKGFQTISGLVTALKTAT